MFSIYCQTSNIICTYIGNTLVYQSDEGGASPVRAAPTTSSFSASVDWAKRSFWIWCLLYWRFDGTKYLVMLFSIHTVFKLPNWKCVPVVTCCFYVSVPMWAIVLIGIGALLLVLCCCFCICKKCCKRRGKKGKGVKGAVDIRGLQLPGSSYKEKVSRDPCSVYDCPGARLSGPAATTGPLTHTAIYVQIWGKLYAVGIGWCKSDVASVYQQGSCIGVASAYHIRVVWKN